MLSNSKSSIYSKTASVCLMVLLISAIPFLLFKATSLLLLLFGSILFAIFFYGIADIIEKFLPFLPKKLCLVLGIILVLGFWYAVFSLIGTTVSDQFQRLSLLLPKTIDNLERIIEEQSWGAYVNDSIESFGNIFGNIAKHLPKFFNNTFGFLGDLYALLFLGVFLMLGPTDYFVGILSLFPTKRKMMVADIGAKIIVQLKIWLQVQVLDMLFVFVLTAIGLLILGIDLWLILACLAGLLTFIPNLGPTLALIPAALVGLMYSPMMAVYIIGIFLLVQLIESAVFAPFVQKRMLSLPPALVLLFQLLLGSLAGALALLFATPILVVIVNLVNEIYVKRILKQETAGEIMKILEKK